MKNIFFLHLIFLSINTFGQITFEKGYFINNNDEKIECLIKNMAWQNNPTEFDYKLNENDEIKIAKIDNVKEFNVSESYAYKKFTVKMDMSSQNLDYLNRNKNLNLTDKIVFLQLLVTGDANLYKYNGSNFKLYYFNKKDNNDAELLIFKEYIIDEKVAENNSYRQQLYLALNSGKLTESDFKNLKYSTEDLTNLFIKYNASDTNKTVNFTKKQNKDVINFKALLGINYLSSYVQPYYTNSQINLDSKIIPGLGIEIGYVLPFNQKKWELFIAPNYQNVNLSNITIFDPIKLYIIYPDYSKYFDGMGSEIINYKVSFSKIKVPVGIRYFLFLNQKSKIFLNIGFILNHILNSNVSFSDKYFDNNKFSLSEDARSTKIYNTTNPFLGIGYSYNKFNFELRYDVYAPILESNIFYYKTTSINLIASYKFF